MESISYYLGLIIYVIGFGIICYQLYIERVNEDNATDDQDYYNDENY